jgi:asparagine synthase (glutamine-hydrolysing)
MGALAAVLTHNARASDHTVLAMLRAAPHRGSLVSTVALGRAVLGVVNGSEHARAWVAQEGDLVAAVAGDVDNLGDVAPAAPNPASAIAALFARLGDSLAAKLRGAYAIVISDGETLWAFRDHIGFGPLFYRIESERMFVGTEPKQIVAGAGIAARPDLEVVERIFYGNVRDETPCAIAGIMRLPKATLLRSRADGLRLERYWHPERILETRPVAADQLRPRFEELMTRAVARVLTDDTVIALSGGIDSPAVASFAAPLYAERTGRPLQAVTAVYPDLPSVDESEYTEAAARAFGIGLHTFRPEARPLDDLAAWVRLVDGPFPATSLAETGEIYRQARRAGGRRVITGEMAEYLIDADREILPHLVWRGRIAAAVRHLRAERRRGASLRRLSRRLVGAATPGFARSLYRRVRPTPSRVPSWLVIPKEHRRALPLGPRRWGQTQLLAFSGPGISGEADEINQEVQGITARRPWCDVDLWEFFLGLPAETKFPTMQRKGLVRELLRGRVPDVILDRRTKTFFDANVERRIDHETLRTLIASSSERIRGVDYATLDRRLAQRELTLPEFVWARDLAAVHAFLAQR